MRGEPAAALGRPAAALVRFSIARPALVLLATLLVTLAAGWITVTRFSLDSNAAKLFPQDLPWRVAELRLDRAFPQRSDLIVAVLDGAEPWALDAAAERLADALRAEPALFRSVRRPDAGEFWARNGLLYLDLDEVRTVTERLIEAQPLLGTIAADPSARGVAEVLRLMGQGLAKGETEPARLAAPFAALAATAEAAARGMVRPPDWRALLTSRAPRPSELRRIVLIQPTLDHTRLSAGTAATESVRRAVARLGLADQGVRVRLTGHVAMADDEFGSIADGAVASTVLSFTLVGLLLWLALRSWRLIWPLLALTVVGILWTAAFGILAVGVFNVLSIAFAVMFIGLAVDFGTQFSVQFRAESARLGATRPALAAAGATVGAGMTLAALAVGASFLAFIPTDYRGIAELGLIAGAGMAIGWWLAVTMLPALMLLAKPAREQREVGYPALRPLDEWLGRHARGVALTGLALGLACAAVLPWLRFDTNPINLRDPDSEAVATWRDLARDPDTDPNTVEILAPNLDAAQALAARLAALPEVARAHTLLNFVPAQQAEKLALIEDAAMLLGITLDPPPAPPPTDAETVAALRAAARELGALRGGGAVTADAARLAAALSRLAEGPPAHRAAFAAATVPGFEDTLARVRAMLAAAPVEVESLPPELRADWITPAGEARVEATPRDAALDETDKLRRFARAVLAVAPDATGLPVSALGSSATIQSAFAVSALIGLAVTVLLVWAALRSLGLALLAVAPLFLAGLLTMAHSALLGPDLNLANVIALPLLFGMGVAYDIYYVAAWQQGRRDLLSSPLNRAVIYSAITNAAAFGALMVSPHPGTASMGVILTVSLFYSLACVMLLLPPLLRLFAPRS
jgi:hopanoid biosynthesis associated RND transporter like protein HpnN